MKDKHARDLAAAAYNLATNLQNEIHPPITGAQITTGTLDASKLTAHEYRVLIRGEHRTPAEIEAELDKLTATIDDLQPTGGQKLRLNGLRILADNEAITGDHWGRLLDRLDDARAEYTKQRKRTYTAEDKADELAAELTTAIETIKTQRAARDVIEQTAASAEAALRTATDELERTQEDLEKQRAAGMYWQREARRLAALHLHHNTPCNIEPIMSGSDPATGDTAHYRLEQDGKVTPLAPAADLTGPSWHEPTGAELAANHPPVGSYAEAAARAMHDLAELGEHTRARAERIERGLQYADLADLAAAGSIVEIDGVKLAPCDEHGRTEADRAAEKWHKLTGLFAGGINPPTIDN